MDIHAMENYPWKLTDVEVLDGQPALGKGAYGIVYRAWWKGTEVAAKRVHESLAAATEGVNGVTNTAVQGIQDEGDTMQRLRHPHLVQFLGIYYDDQNRLYIVMEKMEESLADLLERSGGPIFETKIYSIGTDIASALRYMHELPTPIAHRDLTPKNILLTADLRAKVSDLGACKYVLKLHAPMTATLAPGNPKYMPPEALDGGRYAKYVPTAVDVFSLAIVLLEMFSGTDPDPSKCNAYLPYPNQPLKFYRVPEEVRRSACFKKIPKDHPLTKLILTCVATDHTQRPAMREIQDTLLSLQGKHVPRERSKPLQSPMRVTHQEKARHSAIVDIDGYDDVSWKDHPYQNVTQPPLPPKGIRSSLNCDAYGYAIQQEGMMGFLGSSQNTAGRRHSITLDSAVADQSGYEPLYLRPNRSGSEGESIKIWQDSYEHPGLVRDISETDYEDANPTLRRTETGPSIRAPDRARTIGRDQAPWIVHTSQKVAHGPPLPPWPNPQKPNFQLKTEEPPVYDTVEDVETVLKVTEPSKKKNTKPFVNVAGHKLAALNVTQNELLITQDIMSRQNDVVHARNTEGKAGWIADTQVQLVKPVNFMHNYSSDGTSSTGILHHLTYGKAGTKMKVIQISSSKIAKGNLETLSSLANTDIVAVDKPNTGGNAFFQIDFLKQRLVRVEGYLLQWAGVMGRFGYPLQWVVEMSPDGMIWKQVGREQQNATAKKSQYWAARQKILGRYLRISLLGTNSEENHMLCLSGMELYGDLYTSLPLDDPYDYTK